MAKRTVDLTWVSENYGESGPPPPKRTTRPRAPPTPSPPLYKAVVKELAEIGTIRVSSSTADIDDTIVPRIKKCLDRANHPNTPEAEAKAALHLASRLMGRYNVSQAEVLAHEPPSTQRQYAGQSVVSMLRVDGDMLKSVAYQSYVVTLCHAMKCFFDCNCYTTTNYWNLELTFYGIAENTVAAAMAFEMAYNLIAEWARPYKGIGGKNSYSHGICDELHRMAKKEKAAEEAQAKEAERDSISATVEQEKAERQAQLDRLAPKSPTSADISGGINGCRSPSHDVGYNMMRLDSEGIDDDSFDGALNSLDDEAGESSDYGFNDAFDSLDEEASEGSDDGIEPDFKVENEDSVDSLGDLDEDISKLIKPEPLSPRASGLYSASSPAPRTQNNIPSPLLKRELTPKVEQKPSTPGEFEQELESKWTSHMQLATFRATATKIADEYLESKGVKLRNRSARNTTIRDRNAYSQGVRDSKKIDVRRKAIKE